MKKAIFAVLAALGMSLVARGLAPAANARTYTYLFPPHQDEGATTDGNATGRAVRPAGGRRQL
jgi:hypothetical protein